MTLLLFLLAATLDAQSAPPGEEIAPREQYPLFIRMRSILQEQRCSTYLALHLDAPAAYAQRQAMDTDLDLQISPEEAAAYLVGIQAGLPNLLRLRLDGAQLALSPLEDPSVEFEEERGVTEHPLILHLAFLSYLPRTQRPPRHLVMENRFFPELPALLTWDILREEDTGAALLAQFQEAFPQYEEAGRPRAASVTLMRAAPAPPATPEAARPAGPEGADDPRGDMRREKLLRPEEDAPPPLQLHEELE